MRDGVVTQRIGKEVDQNDVGLRPGDGLLGWERTGHQGEEEAMR